MYWKKYCSGRSDLKPGAKEYWHIWKASNQSQGDTGVRALDLAKAQMWPYFAVLFLLIKFLIAKFELMVLASDFQIQQLSAMPKPETLSQSRCIHCKLLLNSH